MGLGETLIFRMIFDRGPPREAVPACRNNFHIITASRKPTKTNFLKLLSFFLASILLTLSSLARAQVATYNWGATSPPCTAANAGYLWYDSGNNLIKYCNGTAWTTLASGAGAAAGANTQVQFNSGGVLGASGNFTWNLSTGTLTTTIYDTNATTGAYKLGGTTILAYPFAGTDTASFAVGPNALVSETATARANTAVGSQALQSATTGIANTAVGYSALNSDTTGTWNTAVGFGAMMGTSAAPLTGSGNTAVGTSVFQNAQGAAAFNTAVGYSALSNATTGSNSTAVGYEALWAATTASGDTALGYNAGMNITTGTQNTAIGNSAMMGPIGVALTGNNNTAVGDSALTQIRGAAAGNTAAGTSALSALTTATNSTAVGYNALLSTTASGDTALGYSAGKYISTGGSNTAIGNSAMLGVIGTKLTGASNTAVGDSALLAIQGAAAGNTAVGQGAGNAGTAITTGTNNTFVGYQAQANAANATNRTAIGQGAVAAADNSVRLGDTNVTAVTTSGQLFGKMIVSTIATVGSLTLTAAQMVGGMIIATGNTAGTWTTDTAANIIAAIPNADTSANGTAFIMYVANPSTSVSKTLAAGTGVTLSGTMTIATGTTRIFLVQVTGAASVAITCIGQLGVP